MSKKLIKKDKEKIPAGTDGNDFMDHKEKNTEVQPKPTVIPEEKKEEVKPVTRNC